MPPAGRARLAGKQYPLPYSSYAPRLPAEWEPHAATWIAWPHNQSDWPGKFEAIPWVYAEIVRWLAWSERTEIIVRDARHESSARRVLKSAGVPPANVRFRRWPTNRGWVRDSGPQFVHWERARGSRAPRLVIATNWRFIAWAKYSDWRLDDALPSRIAEALGLIEVEALTEVRGRPWQVVLEGGSIDVNGRGTMLTTEECLLSRKQQRNPGLSRDDMERIFCAYLGIRKVLWLGRGIAGDDTHGHVDDIARFVGSRTVVAAIEKDPADVNHKPLRENLRRLRRMTDQDGRRLQVVELPMPAPVFFRGQRLPASYANFYIANRAVLVPTFNDPADAMALNVLAKLFPRRRVVGIHCRDLVLGLGTLHCLTMQQPA